MNNVVVLDVEFGVRRCTFYDSFTQCHTHNYTHVHTHTHTFTHIHIFVVGVLHKYKGKLLLVINIPYMCTLCCIPYVHTSHCVGARPSLSGSGFSSGLVRDSREATLQSGGCWVGGLLDVMISF